MFQKCNAEIKYKNKDPKNWGLMDFFFYFVFFFLCFVNAYRLAYNHEIETFEDAGILNYSKKS